MSLSLVFQSKGKLLNTAQRATSYTTPRSMTTFSHMSNNDPKVMEEEKKKQEKEGHKEWSEKLASESEAAVKADQDNEKSVKDLQEETKEKLKKE
ncbi:hypothetical protein BDA99DRAFT_566396 [Phascolomyces articulosus]|uniref:Uncharacterized protein n=1 Tax=Phascolomyces articulosus TaxID=60185 RepID=A0AAD5JXA5_9FUNG|nr:hypothetical protein BDA99DRAFT_566396 [Phascolomyces articulosus]